MAVKRVICLDPNNCESDSDMYANFYSKEKLAIVFRDDYSPISEAMTFEFAITDLFFISKKGAIGFNIVGYAAPDSNQHYIILGLKFLNKCNLMLTYNQQESNFDLILFEKRRDADDNLNLFVLFSVFAASLISLFVIEKTKPGIEIDRALSSSSSLQVLANP